MQVERPMVAVSAHNLRSSHREALLEHLFAGEIMKRLWLRGEWRLEILKPQVDDGGYDLVLEANGFARHVQLKASFRGSTTRRVPINAFLAAKPSGCVVFMWFDEGSLELGPFLYLGGVPGEPLPDLSSRKVARQTKANARGVKAERPNVRSVPLSMFKKVGSVDQLVTLLFGKE